MTNGYQTPQAYSPEYYQTLADMYQRTTKPLYEEEAARIKQALGGKGALYGTPIYQNLGKLGQQRMTGLENTLSSAMLQGSQFKAQEPYQQMQMAGQLGYMPGASQLSMLGLPTGMAGQQIQMTPYQQALAQQTSLQQQIQQQQAYFNMLASLVQGLGLTSGLEDFDWGDLFS